MSQPLTDLGRSLSDATLRVHHAIAQKAGLSGTDHKYIGMLTRHGAMTAGELGRLSGLSSGAVTGLVDRLEQKSLVSRRADPDDRRKILIVPNASNIQRLLGPSSARLEQKVRAHVKKLSDRDAQVIEKYLRETIGILNDLSAKLQQEIAEDFR
jgi:DNA-binding MarR family transcriptional regulator